MTEYCEHSDAKLKRKKMHLLDHIIVALMAIAIVALSLFVYFFKSLGGLL